jgi:hypothetical protein
VRFETHDGGVWVARSAHPQIDMVKPIVVGSNVFLGYGAIIMPGVTIGDNVVIGAGAVVTRDIPANSVAVGVPARVIRSTGAYIADALTRGESTKAMTRREKRHSTKQNTAPSHKGHCQPPLADHPARMSSNLSEKTPQAMRWRRRRFVPALVVPAFEHVEHRGPAVHRLGIAEGEGRDARAGLVGHGQIGAACTLSPAHSIISLIR